MKKSETENNISIDLKKCNGCLECINVCQAGLIYFTGKITKTGQKLIKFSDKGQCSACTLCALVCPQAAIEVSAVNIEPQIAS